MVGFAQWDDNFRWFFFTIDVYIKDMIDQWFIVNFVGFLSKSILIALYILRLSHMYLIFSTAHRLALFVLVFTLCSLSRSEHALSALS